MGDEDSEDELPQAEPSYIKGGRHNTDPREAVLTADIVAMIQTLQMQIVAQSVGCTLSHNKQPSSSCPADSDNPYGGGNDGEEGMGFYVALNSLGHFPTR